MDTTNNDSSDIFSAGALALAAFNLITRTIHELQGHEILTAAQVSQIYGDVIAGLDEIVKHPGAYQPVAKEAQAALRRVHS